jgi:magnesium transporter
MAGKPRSNRSPRRNKRPDYSRKIGQPPGALIHIGEIKTAKPSITLFDYDETGFFESRFDSIEASRSYQPNCRVLWLNVYGLQEPEVMAEIGRRFKLHALTLEDILNTHQRPKLDDYGHYLFFVARVWRPVDDSGELVSDQISIVLGSRFVLTFQERPGGLFEPVRERLRKGAGLLRQNGPDYLAYSLLDAVVDHYFGTLEALSAQADRIEDQLADGSIAPIAHMRAINLLKHETRELRRSIWPLREVLAGLTRVEEHLICKTTQLYLRDVYDHVVQVVESLDAIRDTAGDLMDLHLALESQRLNQEVRVLAVLSVLFLPATLISGVFGMNFHFMPWLDRPDGFKLAMLLMLAAAGSLTALFWRRRWLRSRV